MCSGLRMTSLKSSQHQFGLTICEVQRWHQRLHQLLTFSSDSGSIPDKADAGYRGFSDLTDIVLSAGNVKGSGLLTTPVSDYPHGDSNPGLLAENQTS